MGNIHFVKIQNSIQNSYECNLMRQSSVKTYNILSLMKNLYPTHIQAILFTTALFISSFYGIQAQTFSATAGPVSQVGGVSTESGASALGTGLSMQQSVGDFISLDLDTWKGELFQDYGYQGEKAKLSPPWHPSIFQRFLSSI